jgi:hypothetical protein
MRLFAVNVTELKQNERLIAYPENLEDAMLVRERANGPLVEADFHAL